MADYAYTTVPGKIKALLAKIRTVGVPSKVTQAWLKTIGFSSSNDTSMLAVLKFVGLTDASGIPNSTWSSYRGSNHRVVLGEAIRNGYSDLFAIYSDANSRPSTELTHVFSTSSSAGAQAISKTVQTFKALVDEAEFHLVSGSQSENSMSAASPLHTASALHPPASKDFSKTQESPEVHINIQIHISPESSADQIDKIFESMARHLYGRKGDE